MFLSFGHEISPHSITDVTKGYQFCCLLNAHRYHNEKSQRNGYKSACAQQTQWDCCTWWFACLQVRIVFLSHPILSKMRRTWLVKAQSFCSHKDLPLFFNFPTHTDFIAFVSFFKDWKIRLSSFAWISYVLKYTSLHLGTITGSVWNRHL